MTTARLRDARMGVVANTMAGTPLAVVTAALRATNAHHRHWAKHLEDRHSRRLFREHWRLSKIQLEEQRFRLDQRAEVIRQLLSLAELYTQRKVQGHPGWEGLRIAHATYDADLGSTQPWKKSFVSTTSAP